MAHGYDVEVTYHGSVTLVRPLTPAAFSWLWSHVADDAMWFAGALAVEPRYLAALLDGMAGDGLHVSA
jgi:hypothetical protein